jgi:TRAP-type C4-dicarboxylate transport system substrate-binding protein
VFVNRAVFESWPADVQSALETAVGEAVALQRQLKTQEEAEAADTIRAAGGEILELTQAERARFLDAVAPIYSEARDRYSPELLALLDL